MSDWITICTLVLVQCAIVLYIVRQVLQNQRSKLPLPPGPLGLPWFGNIINVNPLAPWETYTEWVRTYGDIVHTRLMGKDVVILNSEKVAKELLENRSKNYSDRPQLTVNEMCGVDFHSAALPYGDRWRLHRRFFHQPFRLDSVSKFQPIQHRKACLFLRRLFDSPDNLDDHLFEFTASVILNCTYGYDPTSRKDELLDIMANVLSIIIPAVRPDAAVVASAFPLLLRLPSWLPGMSFKRRMIMAREFSKQYIERPFEYSLQKLSSGTFIPSMAHDALRDMEEKGITPDETWMKLLKEASGSSFLAASETSHSALLNFFLMMMLHPEIQEKAQAQIDAVTGKARLPTVDDRHLLPYLDAIFREMHRHNPVLPLSLPHATVEDDVYNGYRIPKGSIVLPNAWSMAHDSSRYPNPYEFFPERFLNQDGSLKPNDIEHIAYGFGRRICVGRHFANTSVWTVMAMVLAVFKILKPVDENGTEITVEPRYTSGVTVQPVPFECRIVPRFSWMDKEKLEQWVSSITAERFSVSDLA